MQPVFNEYIKFLKDKGYDLPISEGAYWYDRGFIKCFTKDGKIHNMYKIKVNDDLSINVFEHKDKHNVEPTQIEDWGGL